MRMRLLPIPLAIGLALVTAPHAATRTSSHCASRATVTPVPGDPGAFRIETGHGSTTARYPSPRLGSPAPLYVIRAYDSTWDADFDFNTEVDTLVVPIGATIRWHLVTGIHTVTNGASSGDPEAGLEFDYLLDEAHPDWDSTFTEPDTIDFFCFFHEPSMVGTLIVSANASVPGGGLPSALSFTRGPAPNPSRGVVNFSVGLPRADRVAIDVLDLAGRRVATIHRGELPAGEHAFGWRGMGERGGPVASGVYALRVQTSQKSITRRFSLLR
jgi:plastocyanin